MAAPQFSADSYLGALHVTKAAVEAVENYLIDRASEIVNLPKDDIQKDVYVLIEDRAGKERLSSIKDFHSLKFPDNTDEVSIHLSTPWTTDKRRLETAVRFNKDPLFSKLQISCSGGSARELALGILEGVRRVLATHRTRHGVLYPPPGLSGGLWGLMIALLVLTSQVKEYPRVGTAMVITSLVLLCYFTVARWLWPHTTFDSPSADRLQKFRSWAITGFAGFIVFGTVLALFRRSLFGI